MAGIEFRFQSFGAPDSGFGIGVPGAGFIRFDGIGLQGMWFEGARHLRGDAREDLVDGGHGGVLGGHEAAHVRHDHDQRHLPSVREERPLLLPTPATAPLPVTPPPLAGSSPLGTPSSRLPFTKSDFAVCEKLETGQIRIHLRVTGEWILQVIVNHF